jgi:AraC-like DNA-binding protein
MTHDLADLPMPPPLPRGWALAPGGWDADLASAVAEAYGPDHIGGPWSEQDTAQVAAAHRHVFARRFYAAIASDQPVGIALAQAQASSHLVRSA